jgi:hypothetical protein
MNEKKFQNGDRVKLADDYIRFLAMTAGVVIPEGQRTGTVIDAHYDYHTWVYMVNWDGFFKLGVIEFGLEALPA